MDEAQRLTTFVSLHFLHGPSVSGAFHLLPVSLSLSQRLF